MSMNLAQGTAVVAHTAEVQFAVLPCADDIDGCCGFAVLE